MEKQEILGIGINTSDTRALEQIESTVFSLLFNFASFSEVNISDSISGHNYRCTQIASVLLDNLNYQNLCLDDQMLFKSSKNVKKYLIQSCGLHDLGKATVPVQILTKPSALSEPELIIMKEHTTRPDLEVFSQLALDGNLFVTIMRECIRSHHENYNGQNGYPDNTSGTNIPFVGRLMRVIDVLDGLMTKSPYSDAYEFEDAYEEIIKLHGVLFDPIIVDSLVTSKQQIRSIMERK